MKKSLLLLFLGVLFMSAQIMAQMTVAGTVTDAGGEPLIGVNIVEKGTTKGTVTDLDGNYSIEVAEGAILVFSYVGYEPQELAAASSLNVTLEEAGILEEVVVSALGIERESRSTSYAQQTVGNEDFNQVSTDVFSSLQSKVAGVKINKSSGQVGGSQRIVIRGEKSITGSNNALIVVDGIPISNAAKGTDDFVNKYSDFGNRGNDVNDDDIESITVLSGPAATALYGSRGSGGVVLITTKSGKGKGPDAKKFKVGINSGVTFDKAYLIFDKQEKYGQGYWKPGGAGNEAPGENFSWGPAYDGIVRGWSAPVLTEEGLVQLARPYSAVPDALEDLFNTGVTTNNTVSFEGFSDRFSYYLSYNNVNNNGIIPTSYYKRNNIVFNGSADLNSKLSTNFGLQYSNVNLDGKSSGSEFNNPYQAGIQQPGNIPLNELRDYESPFHNFEGYYGSYTPNPFYVMENEQHISKTNNILGRMELTYKPIDGLSLTARVGDNITTQVVENQTPKFAYTTDIWNPDNIGGSRANDPGEYNIQTSFRNDLTLDALATYSKELPADISLTTILGYNFYSRSTKATSSTTTGGLVLPGFYNLSNSVQTPTTADAQTKYRIGGVFGNVNIGWRNFLFVDYSARNDWSSTLPLANNSFFYQSGGLSLVVTDMVDMGEKMNWLSYLKLRGNIGTSGKDAPLYALETTFVSNPGFNNYSGTGYTMQFPLIGPDGATVSGATLGNTIGSPDLKPEQTFQWEVGADIALFKNRIQADYTYYQSKSTNLLVNVLLPHSSGYTSQTKNIGEIENKGHELSVNVTPVQNVRNVKLDMYFTFTKNKNKVIKVSDDSDELAIGGSTVAGIAAKEGLPYGAWQVQDYERDPEGNIVVGADGYPIVASERVYTGQTYQADYQMGFGSTLSWKGLSASVQFGLSKGGYFYSGTKNLSDFNGTSLTSLVNDRQPYLVPGSVVDNGDGTYSENTVGVYDLYPLVSNFPTSFDLIDASYLKLREATITYRLPSKLFDSVQGLSGISIAFVGNNLKFWLPGENKFADPESNSSGLNGNSQAFEFATLPSTRSMGFNVKIDF